MPSAVEQPADHVVEFTGIPAAVVVTFSAGNLVHCASPVKGNRFVFADNDESQTGQKSAEQTGLPWTMADTVGWDANDLHKAKGLFSVVQKIMECKKNFAMMQPVETL